ncbi:PREDICTED: endoglucanase 19-like isoform X2 [Camelina sativa]|uniref:Endoglucanase n=1 Tax=Camelina sativa TaxID=90675 RepID=A0ABM0VFS1_CAMSA|nr:PREDICTED: endoglucanase 19-like isoform X2 [Camelina sativa]
MGSTITISILVLVLLLGLVQLAVSGHDYKQALSKSILFFEAQRSGHLPPNQRVSWRSHSGLYDGKSSGVDLVGGYYDAGDNVKFGLPMAFTVTTMCWSIIEYGGQLESNGELGHALDAVKWGTDYFIKAHPEPNVLYGEVGDGKSDHYCWQRPEEMTTDRKAYKIDRNNPGSDLAGETAAAMAAASIVFRRSNPAYSAELICHARQLFEFADKYRGKYDSSITVAQKYYRSVSGYNDELLWAAAWLYQATNDKYYVDYLGKNGDSMGGTGWSITEFSWDVKYAGVQTLVAKVLMQGKAGEHTAVFERYQEKAEQYMCSLLGKGTKNIKKTPGGLIFRQSWNNMQFVTSASFLSAVYSDYLSSSKRDLRCSQGNISPSKLLDFSKSQVDYILGDNPRATSYMVGYGVNYPRQVHHRGSSIVSFNVDKKFVTCRGGYATWYSRKGSDPNVLTGAIVGGPDAYDNFADQRDNYEQTEPATYNNAPLLGVLARLISGPRGSDQLLPGGSPTPSPVVIKPAPLPKKKPTTPPASSPSPITISQKMTNSWKDEGKVYYRYSTRLTNRSTKTLTNLKISFTKLYGPIWGVTKTGNSYGFPSWIQSLPAGKSMEFVYIHSAPQANVLVSNYSLE